MGRVFCKSLAVFILLGLIFPYFALAQEINTPQTLEEAKGVGEKALETIKTELPGILIKIWKEEVLPVWQAMWDWFEKSVWLKVWPLAEKEISKRKPGLKEEFQKEKEEVKQEAPQIGKSLWERFKEIIK